MSAGRVSILARAVDRAREARGWSVTELAARAEVSRSALQMWLKGQRSLSLKAFERILRALGVYQAVCDALRP